jgi:hypothetical protein
MSTAAAMAGTLLCVAGAAKVADRDAVTPLLRGAGAPGWALAPAHVAVPSVELACGAWLLSGVAAPWAAATAVLLAAAFVAMLLLASARGVAEPCRCFGALDRVRSHRLSLARAVLLLGAAVAAVLPAGEAARLAPEWWLGVLLALTAVLAFALAGEVESFRTGVRRELAAQTRVNNGGRHGERIPDR